ncbi:MAG: prolyl oligopeptidase family serine peptidase [Candidatus Pacearchaeota archaeon]|nr:prolyl oligopeptidase family serine peptidase [Candidatus Pacearchaeota archaeon]
MKEPILRAYYGGIFFEFILQEKTADAIIILPGFPSGNDFKDLIKIFYNQGYHVFVPRYRGSYQSSGKFLSKNPVDDMIMFVRHLGSGSAKSLWDGKKKVFNINRKILVGSGFGGSIALGVAAKYPGFSHLIVAAPIWDFVKHNKDNDEQDLKKITEFVKAAYQNCYRYDFSDIVKKLKKFEELKPDFYLPRLTLPILVLHDTNDKFVAFRNSKEMVGKLSKGTLVEHYLGHKLSADLVNALWKDIDKFIKVNYVQ